MSSWVHGPERGLHPIEKEDGEVNDPEVTFNPALVSDPSLREKVKSSSYGVEVPKIEKVVLEPHDLRPWEEQPTFRPELPESDLRAKVKSSSYGVVVPTKEQPQAPTPTFAPELVTRSSKVSLTWAEKASSSKYGREIASPVRPKTAPAPSFTPEIPKSVYREKIHQSVQSSRYGKVNASRPQTAGAREVKLAKEARERPRTAEPRKKAESAPDLFDLRASGEGFILDGVHVAECLRVAQRKGVKITENLGSPRELPHAERTRAMTLNAKSHNYGTAHPERGPKPEPKPSEPHLYFDRKSVLDQPLNPFDIKSPLNEKVQSHKYGTEVYTPPKGERPPPKAPEPMWVLGKPEKAPELEPVPRNPLNDKVASHNYGVATPEKAERPQTVPEPVWVPSSGRKGIPAPEPFVRKTNPYDTVRSHYGKDYSPSANGSLNGDATY